jgi:hypothetical protein
MSKAPTFRFLILVYAADGTFLGQCPVVPDVHPIAEQAQFQALRLAWTVLTDVPARIDPIWDEKSREPLIQGLRVFVRTTRGAEVAAEAPVSFFGPQAREVASELIRLGLLKDGDTFQYRVKAFACSEEAEEPATVAPQWSVTAVARSPICGERSLAAFMAASDRSGPPDEFDDFPVFISAAVLDLAETLMEQAGENETGGVLIGHLWRDTQSPELFAEIAALIPAQHSAATSTKLTFTAETWQAARDAMRLRNRNEMFLGWHHTHPARYWCKCDAEKQKTCPLGEQFFSSADLDVARAVFARPYHTMLVTGDLPTPNLGWQRESALFGWRDTTVQRRGFYVLSRSPDPESVEAGNSGRSDDARPISHRTAEEPSAAAGIAARDARNAQSDGEHVSCVQPAREEQEHAEAI